MFLFTLVLCFFLFQSCSQTPQITIPTGQPKPKENLESAAFHKAEQLYKTHALAQALEMYKKYLERAPEDNNQFTDITLMKIGSIYTIQGKFEQAKKIYKKLIQDHPNSIYASRAQLGLIYNDFRQKKYEEALQQIEPAFIVTNQKDHSQLYLLKGDILLALDRAQEAVVAYTYAFEFATHNELPLIIKRTRQAITILTPDELQYLISVYEGRFPALYMRYQHAQNEIKSENTPQAISILEKLVDDYPDHEMITIIQEQIESIKKGNLFESYTIGCLLPLSGKYKQFGQEALNGALFAHSQFSTLQNVYPIQLKIQDSGETVADAIQAFNKLVEANVKAIIGPITTNQAEAVALSANANQIPIILLVSREGITQNLDYVFRNFLTQELQIHAITSYAMDEIGYRDFAILYPDDRYGQSFMDAFWDAVVEKGGTVRAVNNYSGNQTDFTESIKKMVGLYFDRPGVSKWRKKKLKPIIDFDAIFIPDRPDMLLMIAPQLKTNDFNNVLLLGTNLWHDDKMIGVSSQKVLGIQDKIHHQGAVFPDLFFCNSQRPHVQQFVSAFEATFGNKPGIWESITYDNAMILFELLNKGNIQYAEQLRDELINMSVYDGLTGMIKFDTQGEAQRQLYLLKVKGDSFEEIGLR